MDLHRPHLNRPSWFFASSVSACFLNSLWIFLSIATACGPSGHNCSGRMVMTSSGFTFLLTIFSFNAGFFWIEFWIAKNLCLYMFVKSGLSHAGWLVYSSYEWFKIHFSRSVQILSSGEMSRRVENFFTTNSRVGFIVLILYFCLIFNPLRAEVNLRKDC